MAESANRAPSLREQMPKTAVWIDRMRAQWGKDYVNGLIRRATKEDEPGLFYAIEGGHVLGTPFPATHSISEYQNVAVLMGTAFAGFIREPEVQHGTR